MIEAGCGGAVSPAIRLVSRPRTALNGPRSRNGRVSSFRGYETLAWYDGTAERVGGRDALGVPLADGAKSTMKAMCGQAMISTF